MFQGDVIGLLNIANKDGGYSDSDRGTLDRIADRIAPVLYAWIQRKLREDERKAAKAEVERLDRQRQLALDAAKLGWWQFDPNTREVQLDDNCKDIFGLSGNTRQTNKILRQIIHQEDLPPLMAKVETALDPVEPQPYATEIRINRPDGQRRWVEAHGSATFDNNGILSFVGTVQDITEKKEAQISLKRLNKKLEQQVAERTAELENRAIKLQNLAIQLSEAEELERQRIAQLLHDDLQQQLVAVKMKLYAINLPPSGSRESDTTIDSCIDLLGGAVEKTRKLSRDLSPVAFNPRGLLEGMDMLADQFKEDYGLAVEVSHTGNPEPDASAINIFLFQAVKELLFNVVKHSGATTANVHVVETQEHIEIRVADDGKGGDLEQVYARRGVEPGFGLFSIEERIHALGGEVTIESVSGDGWITTLTVPKTAQVEPKMPKAARDDDISADAASAAGEVPSTQASRECIRILVADDHEAMREGLASLLSQQEGLRVIGQAGNGREVVSLAGKYHPDVVLMDVSMPELNGIEATKRILRIAPEIVVIGLSMYDDEGTRQKIAAAGAAAYVSKSEATERIVETIKELVRGKEPLTPDQ